jgi:hypothetical protein
MRIGGAALFERALLGGSALGGRRIIVMIIMSTFQIDVKPSVDHSQHPVSNCAL